MLDPVTLSIINARLEQVASEIDATFVRTAFSPVISEARDVAGGIYDGRDGTVIAQGERSMPIFIASMQFAVQHMIRLGDWEPGDVAISNDPYLGGTHLPDVKMLRPFYFGDELFAYLGSAGHWADIGGASPGGFNSRATEIYQEGIRIPAIKIVRRGVTNEAALDLLLANIRIPEQRRGDFRAQLLSLESGYRRLTELLDEYGSETVTQAIAQLRERGRRVASEVFASLPEGRLVGEEILDGDGIVDRPVRIRVAVERVDDKLVVDFEGSDPPCDGPINAAYSTTVSAVMVALKHLFPSLPVNGGAFDRLEVLVPDECFLNAKFPRPVAAAAAEVSQRVIEAVFRAVAAADATKAMAGSAATVTNIALGGSSGRGQYVLYTWSGGGYGASNEGDGLTFGCALVGSAMTPPIEIYEALYPIRVREFSIVEQSSGDGRFRGGYGARIDYELVEGTAEATVMGDRGRTGPPGLAGGEDGSRNSVVFTLDGTEWIPPHLTKAAGIKMHAGDRITIETPGGGGYGLPRERHRDDRSRDAARRHSGDN